MHSSINRLTGINQMRQNHKRMRMTRTSQSTTEQLREIKTHPLGSFKNTQQRWTHSCPALAFLKRAGSSFPESPAPSSEPTFSMLPRHQKQSQATAHKLEHVTEYNLFVVAVILIPSTDPLFIHLFIYFRSNGSHEENEAVMM